MLKRRKIPYTSIPLRPSNSNSYKEFFKRAVSNLYIFKYFEVLKTLKNILVSKATL